MVVSLLVLVKLHLVLHQYKKDVKINEDIDLDEGYEKEILLILKDAGISGSFRSGKLYVDKQDVKEKVIIEIPRD